MSAALAPDVRAVLTKLQSILEGAQPVSETPYQRGFRAGELAAIKFAIQIADESEAMRKEEVAP